MMNADLSQIYAGIISDDDEQQYIIRSALLAIGIKVRLSSSPSALQESMFGSNKIQLWVIDLVTQDKWDGFIDRIIAESPATLMFGDGNAPATSSGKYPRWQKRLLHKISKLLDIGVVKTPAQIRSLNEQTNHLLTSSAASSEKPSSVSPSVGEGSSSFFSGNSKKPGQKKSSALIATRVWVLGASLGGPSAVKLFLDALEPGLPVAFILAQHIDLGFQALLGEVLVRNNQFEILKEYDGAQLKCGQILIAPADYAIDIERTGHIKKTTEEWQGPYSPCINQVMGLVGKQYGILSGAIIFSGMGDDSAGAAKYLSSVGGVILAQSEETCVNSSQPDSIRETGHVNFSGSPEELATQLMLELKF